MKRARPSDFPQLNQMLSGYFHEDFLEEYESPSAALRAFMDDANPSERKRVAAEARRFLALTADVEFGEVVNLLHRLGARWVPESREALRAVLGHVTPLSRHQE